MPRHPKDCSEFAATITEMALNIGSRPGIKDLDDVVVEMKKLLPEIDRAQIVASIVEATTGHAQVQDELTRKLNSLKREARRDARLRDAIAEYEAHVSAGTRPPKQGAPASPKAIEHLKKRLKVLRSQVKPDNESYRQKIQKRIDELEQHIAQGTAPAIENLRTRQVPQDILSLRRKRDMLMRALRRSEPQAIEHLEKRIAELEHHLKHGTLPGGRPRTTIPRTERVQQLREARDGLLKAINKSDPAIKNRYEKQIANLTERLESNSVAPPIKRDNSLKNKELEQLAYQRDRLRKQIRAKINALRPKSAWGHAREPLNAARSILTSIDFSAVFRQGGFVVLGHPVRALKAMGPMFRSFASEQAAYKVEQEILNRPNAPLYARAKLYLASGDSAAGLTKMEEAYQSSWAEKIPLVRGSQRAYTTFLNRLRADSFDAMAAGLSSRGQVTLEEAKAIANFVNVATGRGSLGAAEPAAQTLNTLFFAPKYVASRFELLTAQPFYGGNAHTRGLIAKEYGRFLIGLGVVYALGMAAGGELEKDPRSADFGKLKFGNTRIDPLAGLSQCTVLLSRIVAGQTKSTTSGEVKDLRGDDVPYGGQTTAGVIGQFLRTKLAPIPSTMVNIVTGENVIGEEVTPLTAARDLAIPLSIRQIYDVMREEGIEHGTAFGLLSIFGMGVQSYEDRKVGKHPKHSSPPRPKRPQSPPSR